MLGILVKPYVMELPEEVQALADARAAARMAREGFTGCKTVFDVPPAYLSSRSAEDLRAH